MNDEMRIIKDGTTKWGKQIYVLVYNNKRIRYSTDMGKLEAIQKEIKMTGIIPPKPKRNPTYKDHARVVKMGFWNGHQRYALRYDGKIREVSIHKEKLDIKAKAINGGLL